MTPQIFVVAPYGAKWGVSSGGEVLAVARTEKAAKDLARKAAAALRAGEAAPPSHVLRHERRSFVNS
jgi:hypothetical protein